MLLAAGYVFVTVYPFFKRPLPKSERPAEVTLEFWGLWDSSDDWDQIIRRFEAKTYHFNGQRVEVRIKYTKKEFSSYEESLQRAKEENKEPNIFMINNNWLRRYVSWLDPLEANKAEEEEYNLVKYEELLDLFPTETIRSLFYGGQLYGFPLYSDSLALYYNKNLFEKAGIENPPATWREFKEDVKKLTVVDKDGNIVQSGAAFGGGRNINRASDILALLMMQGGAKVVDANGNIDINKEIEVKAKSGIEKREPGKRAVIFYTEFSDPRKEVYSWNDKFENSVEAFAHQRTAMMFNYSYQEKNLLVLNPDLNYGIAKMPQIANSTVVNFSNVWTPVVSKSNNCRVDPPKMLDKIDCSKIAWSFLSFAVQRENNKLYLNSTGKAAARKDLIAEQINLNDKVSVFASQAETAISYNKFNDRIDDILVDMIDEVNSDRENWEKKVDAAVQKIEQMEWKS